MKKITLLITFNLLVITLFGQMFMEGFPHPFESDEMHHTSNTNEQFQLKQAEKLKLDSGIFEAYDADLDQWDISGKNEYTYNENENISLRQYFLWNNSTQQWELDRQYDYAYDNAGNRTLFMLSSENIHTQEWGPDFKYEYTYDNEARLTTTLFSTWDNDTQQLLPSSKREYTYDGIDEPTQQLYSRWDTDTQQWLPWNLYDYTYNDGLLMSRLRSAWNPTTQQWSPNIRYDYTYDSERDLIVYLISTPNSSGQQWIVDYQYSYTFDSNRNLITEFYSDWDNEAQQWIPEQRYDFTYDNSYTSEDLIIHFLERYTRHKLTGYTYKVWDENTELWNTSGRNTFYFSEQTVSITPATEAGIEIFPNPANDFITFNLKDTKPATVQLYDAQGRHIHTQALAQNNQLSVRQLDSGVYFYQLNYDGEVFGGKFIVK